MRTAVYGGILVVVVVAFGLTGAAGAASLDGNETNLTGTVSDTTNTVTDTVDSTTDSTTDTTDTVDSTTDTTGTVDSTTDSTTDTTDDTVNDTTATLNATTLLLLDGAVSLTNGTLDATVYTSSTLGTTTPTRTPTPTPAAVAAPPVQTAGGASETGAGPGERDETATSVVAMTSAAAAAGIALGSGHPSTTLSGATTTARAAFDRLLRMLAPFRYSRYDGSDPLEHDDRRRLFEVVEDNPGIYLSATSEAADMPLSTVRHHLRVLEREEMVERANIRGRRRLFPAHSEAPELAAALEDDATAAVLEALARVGACSTSELAAEIDRSASTVSHHLSRLADDGLVEREQQGRAKVSKLAPVAAEALAEEPPTPSARTPVEAD